MKTLTIHTLIFLSLTLCLRAQPITATVQAIDPDNHTFTLVDIDAMGKPAPKAPLSVRVGNGDLLVDYGGKKIRATLSMSDGKRWLEKIWPVYPDMEKVMQSVNDQLRADTAVRRRQKFRKEGDYGINFAMFNEHGDIVQFNQFKGKWVIMNFIFTRCRMQEMCPAQTARMVSLQRMAKQEKIEHIQQLSITFDPTYDTPGILSQYARVKEADTATFSFLTGKKDTMLDVLKQYGVIAFDSKNIIDHTVTTLLFDKNGVIVLRRDGTQWNASDFIDKILKERDTTYSD
jgi:protein SCO1